MVPGNMTAITTDDDHGDDDEEDDKDDNDDDDYDSVSNDRGMRVPRGPAGSARVTTCECPRPTPWKSVACPPSPSSSFASARPLSSRAESSRGSRHRERDIVDQVSYRSAGAIKVTTSIFQVDRGDAPREVQEPRDATRRVQLAFDNDNKTTWPFIPALVTFPSGYSGENEQDNSDCTSES